LRANKTEFRRIESIQLAAVKRILGVSSKTIDIPISLDLGIMSLETRRKIAMLKWAGKIARMHDSRLVNKIYNEINFKWTGKHRARRKTWKRWVNDIVEEFNILAQFEKIGEFSREKWNKIIKEAASRSELNVLMIRLVTVVS